MVKSEMERAIVLKSQTNWPIVLGHAPIVQGPIVFISETNRPIVLGSIVFISHYYNYSCLDIIMQKMKGDEKQFL